MLHAIEARSLVKTYPGDVRALSGVSFDVEQGTVFALVGPNGAGKSTLVKLLTTLSRPDSGEARVLGLDVLRRPDRVRRVIGCVNQHPGVDRDATAREDLLLQGRLYGLRGTELKTRVQELFEQFGLTDAADRVTRTFSGGMRRKLDIALGLVHKPQVLFLDEPTTGLDPQARADMWNEIRRLVGDEGMTILLTTHYLDEADRLAGRVAIVDGGSIVVEGTPDELKSELRGDAVHVELDEVAGQDGAAAEGRVRAAVDGLAEIRDVAVDGRRLYARSDDGARAVPAVLQALEAHGIAVVSVTVARPSLDDVYLRYTGRTFSEADHESETAIFKRRWNRQRSWP
jgi:ABC-2 type transport system ATP-binding protein